MLPSPRRSRPARSKTSHQAVALQVMEDAVTGNRDAAAFLTPVLQGVEPKVHVPGDSTLDGRPDAEYAAFLMHKADPPKKEKASFSIN